MKGRRRPSKARAPISPNRRWRIRRPLQGRIVRCLLDSTYFTTAWDGNSTIGRPRSRSGSRQAPAVARSELWLCPQECSLKTIAQRFWGRLECIVGWTSPTQSSIASTPSRLSRSRLSFRQLRGLVHKRWRQQFLPWRSEGRYSSPPAPFRAPTLGPRAARSSVKALTRRF